GRHEDDGHALSIRTIGRLELAPFEKRHANGAEVPVGHDVRKYADSLGPDGQLDTFEQSAPLERTESWGAPVSSRPTARPGECAPDPATFGRIPRSAFSSPEPGWG